MLNFFKKKKKKPFDYIMFLENNKNIIFNLNLLRNAEMDIQVFNQVLNLNNDIIEIDDETGFSIVFSFFSKETKSFLRFQKSEYYDDFKSSKTKDFNKYVYNINYNTDYLRSILKFATEEIYAYTNEDVNQIEFFLFLKDGRVLDIRKWSDIPNIEELKMVGDYL